MRGLSFPPDIRSNVRAEGAGSRASGAVQPGKGDHVMAEQIVLVCDTCGRPATGAVNFSVVASGSARNAQRFTKDLCDTHLSELIKNARKPRRGRRRGSV